MFSAIARDIRTAHDHFHLHWKLENSKRPFNREMNEARVFWRWTMNAHLITAQIALARAYDKDFRGLNLKMLLTKLHDSKSSTWRPKHTGRMPPTPKEFAADISSVTWWRADKKKKLRGRRNPLVRKLIWNRNNLFAHANWEVAITGQIPKRHRLTYGEYDTLIKRAIELLNKYGQIYIGTTYSVQMPDADDYLKVLKAQRLSVRQYRKGIADEYRAARKAGEL